MWTDSVESWLRLAKCFSPKTGEVLFCWTSSGGGAVLVEEPFGAEAFSLLFSVEKTKRHRHLQPGRCRAFLKTLNLATIWTSKLLPTDVEELDISGRGFPVGANEP